MPDPRLPLLAISLLTLALPAQDATRSPDALFLDACKTMRDLPAVSFATTETQDAAMTRRFRKMMPQAAEGASEVEGTACSDHAWLRVGDDKEEVVVHGTRMLARADDGAWKLRRGTLANGTPMPFVLDPGAFFESLVALPDAARKVQHEEKGKTKDAETLVLTITVTGKAADELRKSGCVPRFAGGPMIFGPLGGAAKDGGKTTFDIALWIDPATKQVCKAVVRGGQESSMPGNVQIRMGHADGGEVEEEEEANEDVKEKDEQGNRIYKGGLPVRKPSKDVSVLDFEVTFKDHGKVKEPELDAEARRLLRMR